MAKASADHSFNPLPTKNILKVISLTNLCLMHLNIIHLTFCNPELVNPFMARHLSIHLTLCRLSLCSDYFIIVLTKCMRSIGNFQNQLLK